MTRTTRKVIAFIVCAAFVVIVLGLLGWATAGFKNWDSATWFDYWGKGKPVKVVKVAEKPAEQKAIAFMSSDGLSYDSDFSEAVTAEVLQFDVPEIEICEDGIHITCSGEHLNAVKVLYGPFMQPFNGSFQLGANVGGISPYTEYVISYAELRSKIGAGPHRVGFCNLGDGSYATSNEVTYTWYIMPEDVEAPVIIINGTHAQIPIPAVTVQNSYRLNCHVEIFADDNEVYKDTFDCFNTPPVENDLYEVVTNADNSYIDIDLTKLSFVSVLLPHCKIIADFIVDYDYMFTKYIPALIYCSPVSFGITKLATPTNVSYSDGMLSWDAVPGAAGYAVFEGDDFRKTTPYTSLLLTDNNSNIGVGVHTLRVRALGNVGSALAETSMAYLTPYNAPMSIVQYVALTLNVDGDNITKLVPYGSTIGEYMYDVKLPEKEFGGWFYDSGYSRKVEKSDVLNGDTTIYARLSDLKVTERPLSWWDLHKWQVLIPIFVLVGIGIVIAVVVGIRKRKAA